MVEPDHRADNSASGAGAGFFGLSDPSGGGAFLCPSTVYSLFLLYCGTGEQGMPSDSSERDVNRRNFVVGCGKGSYC